VAEREGFRRREDRRGFREKVLRSFSIAFARAGVAVSSKYPIKRLTIFPAAISRFDFFFRTSKVYAQN
jgi:hypothetical protein